MQSVGRESPSSGLTRRSSEIAVSLDLRVKPEDDNSLPEDDNSLPEDDDSLPKDDDSLREDEFVTRR